MDVDALSRAVRHAEEVACKSAEALELLAAAKQVKKLRTALAAGAWDTVRNILEETKEMVIADAAMGEFMLAQDELDNQSLLEMLSEALEHGHATGAVGGIDLSSVHVASLDKSIAFGLEHGAKTTEAQQLLAAAKLIRRLRSVLLSGNWDWVGGVLSDARAMKDALPVCSLKELQVRRLCARCIVITRLQTCCSACVRCSSPKMSWTIAA